MKKRLCASLDDNISWCEEDFPTTEEFCDEIAAWIAPLINRTVKYVTERKKHRFIRCATYAQAAGETEWTLLDEHVLRGWFLRLFLFRNKTEEILREYRI